MKSDDRDFARRIAAMDQARAGATDVARISAAFYTELRKARVPRQLSATLTEILVERLITPPGGEA